MFYEVIAQFAKANAPTFRTSGFEPYLMEAKDYFNMKSRVATNPKEITELTVIDDQTLRIIFRSQEILNISQVSRSLRVFSMYLVDESHPLNFGDLVSGKRLFRMSASEFGDISEENSDISDAGEMSEKDAKEINKLNLLKKVIGILEKSDDDSEANKVTQKINEIVKNFYNDLSEF